jgi:hypothetical protein
LEEVAMAEPKPSRKCFEEWREPSEFYRAADEALQGFFCAGATPEHDLREAWVVGAFGRIWRDNRGPCKVRLLAKGGSPDAQLRADGIHLDLEVTMALPSKYEVFNEWRELLAKTERGEILCTKTFEQSQADAREAISRMVGKKAGKHYAEPPTLLVSTGDGWALPPEEIGGLTEPWKDRFKAIYLFRGIDVVLVWPELSVLKVKEPF